MTAALTPPPISGPCTQGDPDMWFSDFLGDREEAKRICDTECPARLDCEQYARTTGERHGIWAASTSPAANSTDSGR